MLELTFMTSSRVKREHAKYLSRSFDISIKQQSYYGRAYIEPRVFGREDLLDQSIEDAQKRWQKYTSNADKKFFFIEDTSVIIHSLSDEYNEVPGVDVKYWMQENTFDSIDTKLKSKGNDRRVTVRSDFILVLTSDLSKKHGENYFQFSSETHGTFTEKEHDIRTNPVYPWLDNKTFNKWFIPSGSKLPISMLAIDEADNHDFRKSAFNQMIEFLDRNEQIQEYKNNQSSLAIDPPLFLISGPTCAGKTTLAEHLVHAFGYYHIEASDFMYLSYHRKLGIGSQTAISAYAKKALIADPEIIVHEILSFIASHTDLPLIVITGLRTCEEIKSFTHRYVGPQSIKTVTISADKDLRLDRYLQRNRGGKTTAEKFHKDCEIQDEMGLDILISDYTQNSFTNENLKKDFFEDFCEKFKGDLINLLPLKNISEITLKPTALEDAILMALRNTQPGYYSTAEIAHQINRAFKHHNIEKNKNNVSRYFNQFFYPFYEAIKEDGVNKYRLSQTGEMHAIYLIQKQINKEMLANTR